MSSSRQRIGVLIDGSGRHLEMAKQSGEAIAAALHEAGHDARPVFVDRDLDLSLRQGRFDVAFLALRGRQGEGSVQGLLEMLGIPYTGAGLLASVLATNPTKAHEVLRLGNVPTAPGYQIGQADRRFLLRRHSGFGFPVAVGPASGGLGLGTAVAADEQELVFAVDQSFRFGDEVRIERFIDGRVIAVGVLEGRALGAADLGPRLPPRLRRAGGFASDAGGEQAPPARPARGRSGVQHPALLRIAEQSCAALQVEGPALVEVIATAKHNEVVRGVDVAPLIAPASLFGRIASDAGFGFGALCAHILAGAKLRGRALPLAQEETRAATRPGRDMPARALALSASLARPARGRASFALPH